MTASEWLTCRNPWVILSELGGQSSDRKLRLFVCACCHRWLDRWNFPVPLWSALTAAEELTERGGSPSDFHLAAELIHEGLATADHLDDMVTTVAEAIAIALQPDPLQSGQAALAADACVESLYLATPYTHPVIERERAAQCDLIREIFRNPFRPSVLHPAWHTATVVSLAEPIYDTGDFNRLPILADALEDAGCTDDAILRHCRDTGQHVKGCWVVDLLLGKQ